MRREITAARVLDGAVKPVLAGVQPRGGSGGFSEAYFSPADLRFSKDIRLQISSRVMLRCGFSTQQSELLARCV